MYNLTHVSTGASDPQGWLTFLFPTNNANMLRYDDLTEVLRQTVNERETYE
jgi:hypothetical protein